MSEEPHPNWKPPLELLVKKEAEKCLALRWAHDESQRWRATWNTRIQLSIFILSVFSGAGGVGAETVLPFSGSGTLVGIISLLVSTLTAINNYLGFAKLAEAHRFSSISYGKLHASLALQLSLPRAERLSAQEVIELIKTETERLNEIAPQLPQIIKDRFHSRFENTDTAVPTILNGLESVGIAPEDPVLGSTPRPSVRIII